MASNASNTDTDPTDIFEIYSPLRLRADYATSLLASVFYGKSLYISSCERGLDNPKGVYLLMSLIILRQIHRRRLRRGGLDSARRFTLIFTIGMLAVTTGWYLASAIHNSLLLAGSILFIPAEDRLDRLTICNPAPIARDVFKSAQILGADGLLVS
jgi:hypothetical protein